MQGASMSQPPSSCGPELQIHGPHRVTVSRLRGMGQAKAYWMEQQERGFSDIDKSVCDECVLDSVIQDFIRLNATALVCDYCGRSSEIRPVAASMDVVLPLIYDGIHSEWRHPEMWNSDEKEWKEYTVDSQELVHSELDLSDNVEVLNDIAGALVNDTWCNCDAFSQPPHMELMSSWKRFSWHVTHRARFLFIRSRKRDEDDALDPSDQAAFDLDRLGAIAQENALIRELPAGTEIYRVRIHKTGERLIAARDLGTCPVESARQSNRMSPAGIPMFYGAFDEETALLEAQDPTRVAGYEATVASFRTLRPMLVLDLSRPIEVPSLFDSDRRLARTDLRFLIAFVQDLAKPVARDDRVHVDYVPTQVVTEYFRHCFTDESGRPVDGILYPSSVNRGKSACVLFVDNDQCVDSDADASKCYAPILVLQGDKTRNCKLPCPVPTKVDPASGANGPGAGNGLLFP